MTKQSFSLFETMGELFNPYSIPEQPMNRIPSDQPEEELDTFQCKRCEALCAGFNEHQLCMHCEKQLKAEANADSLREFDAEDKYEQLNRDYELDIEKTYEP